MAETYYAHTKDNEPPEKWQRLEEHLQAVADRAASFASAFDAGNHGYLAGLWHDLGKYRPEFQAYIRGHSPSSPHASIGAIKAGTVLPKNADRWLPIAFAIAGHHGGLPNLVTSTDAERRPLKTRLKEDAQLLSLVEGTVPAHIWNRALPEVPAWLQPTAKQNDRLARSVEFWIRFLFSALVDADYLDTESFMTPANTRLRTKAYLTIEELRTRLEQHIDELAKRAAPSPVNQLRADVLAACRKNASMPPGHFSLTVPTGGGKTLSALDFALRHAEQHGLRRVVVVIPYTSIIEQNAGVYREALGADNVVEHHSNLDPKQREAVYGRELTQQHALASENWDAPIVVTTTVQFFESLFANKPSQCRKLHNISRSVVILDEVQSLPAEFLTSILDALNELVDHYGCSVVLSTATPPALSAREGFDGLANVRPIVSSVDLSVEPPARVAFAWPDVDAPAESWPELADRMGRESRVLAIVHKREDARVLAEAVSRGTGEAVFHLSALMCPAHRLSKLADIKTALKGQGVCRVVSTQLVEAGVDLDFPVVFRALGGLDSMVQAAGRCNREGRLPMPGRVVVFRAPSSPPMGTPRKGLQATESLLREYGERLDVEIVGLFEKYFRMLYGTCNLDAKSILVARRSFEYEAVASAFCLIEDGFSVPVVVPYADAEDRLERLRKTGASRDALRSLQPFTVSIYQQAVKRLHDSGALELVAETILCLTKPFHHLYHTQSGLYVASEIGADPASLVVD